MTTNRKGNMYPQPPLFSEIKPNLFMGGTDDFDVIHFAQNSYAKRKDLPFEAIVTMYAWARPADWSIQEFRYGVPDASIKEIDLNRLREAVDFGFNRWQSGDRVLVRCQAGLNRSGLVTALILIRSGITADDAIKMIREKRDEYALYNEEYVAFLMEHGDTFFSPSQQAA
ncbi:MAG: dual specificity protein phosphatase family protein [Actinomycetota bacterium]